MIALDAPPDPGDTVDITFVTDNLQAGGHARLDFYDTGVALVAPDQKVDGLNSVSVDEGKKLCWGK